MVGGASKQCCGVTAGKASHNARNARGVTAGKMGRNSSANNDDSLKSEQHTNFFQIPPSAMVDNEHNIIYVARRPPIVGARRCTYYYVQYFVGDKAVSCFFHVGLLL